MRFCRIRWAMWIFLGLLARLAHEKYFAQLSRKNAGNDTGSYPTTLCAFCIFMRQPCLAYFLQLTTPAKNYIIDHDNKHGRNDNYETY